MPAARGAGATAPRAAHAWGAQLTVISTVRHRWATGAVAEGEQESGRLRAGENRATSRHPRPVTNSTEREIGIYRTGEEGCGETMPQPPVGGPEGPPGVFKYGQLLQWGRPATARAGWVGCGVARSSPCRANRMRGGWRPRRRCALSAQW